MRRSSAPSSRIGASSAGVSKLEPQEKPLWNTKIRNTESILSLLSTTNKIEEPQNDETTLEASKVVNKDDNISNIDLKKIFNVVYGKQSKKKHKTWEGDGTLEVSGKTMILKDVDGKILGSGMVSKNKPPEEGVQLFVGSKEVEIIELVATKDKETDCKRPANEVLQNPVKKKQASKFILPKIGEATKVINKEHLFVLPEPSLEHQWKFNTNQEPVRQVIVEDWLAKKLRPHQRQGVIFLYECVMGFQDHELEGAILADEMGLGKTLQCIALVWTLLRQNCYTKKPTLQKVLIVTPSSLTTNWKNEFEKWLGLGRICPYVVSPKQKVSDFQSQPTVSNCVMIISYEMFVRCFEEIEELNIKFDLLICDEGHRLKNSNIRTYQLLNQLMCNKRILLTGTPVQNDLSEFYTIINFVNPGALGTPGHYKKYYEDPIVASRQPSAEIEVQTLGEERASELNQLTCRFILRRTQDLLDGFLPSKHEVVVFCKLSPLQKQVYTTAIEYLNDCKENLIKFSDGVAHLGLITKLKKICNHPALLQSVEAEESVCDDFPLNNSTIPVELSTDHSSKLTVVMNLLQELRARGKEKVVLVSYYTQTLDMLADVCQQCSYPTCRLDGSTSSVNRAEVVRRFNAPTSNLFIFLLSAKAGGVGLNLIGASRLILFDTDWNPASDLQAMSRIWRDGQKRSVFIYRLLTSGTIEEKIYQRQISKQGLSGGVVDTQVNDVKLSSEELRDIFTYNEDSECATHDLLQCPCLKQGTVPPDGDVGLLDNKNGQLELQVQQKGLLRMNDLMKWEHYGAPWNSGLLHTLCLNQVQHLISFIFKNSSE